MTKLTRVLALAAIAAALFAVGCGDDDDDDTGSTATTTEEGTTGVTGVAETKEQWIATADEVCENADEELTDALEQAGLGENPSDQELQTVVSTTVIPIQQSVLETLRGLAPPEGEEESVNEILDELESGLETMEADPAAALEEGPNNPLAGAAQLAEDYGLQECGS